MIFTSIRYRDSQGQETIIAGLTPGGDIEAGTVAQRSDTFTIADIAVGGDKALDVVFADPMPDADYIITFEQLTSMCLCSITENTKTINGFQIKCRNLSDEVKTCKGTWFATKTYTVQHAQQNAEAINDMQSKIPVIASASNQLTAQSYVDAADGALDTRLNSIEEAVPASASITNKLVTAQQLDSLTAGDVSYNNTVSELSATTVQGAIDEVIGGLGTAASKAATTRVSPDNTGLVESNAVYHAINSALSSIYTPRGDLTCAELTSSLLNSTNVGNIYEMSDAGTTSDLFLQGAGRTINIGDNVGIIQTGDTYKFNLMANAFDLTDYQRKTLDTPLTIGGVRRTEVESALGGLNSLIPNSTSTSNKLMAQSDNLVLSKNYNGATYTTISTLFAQLVTDITALKQYGGAIGCVWTGKSYFSGTFGKNGDNGHVQLHFENAQSGYTECKFNYSSNGVGTVTWYNDNSQFHANDDTDVVDVSSSFTKESFVSGLSVTAYRKGNVVSLNVNMSATIQSSSMGTLQICSGSLPAKYRPKMEQSCAVSGYRGSLNDGFSMGRLVLLTDGTIALGERYFVGNGGAGRYDYKWSLTYLV